jgi:hypothetical protein
MFSGSRAWRVGACATATMAAVLIGLSGAGAASAGTGAQGPGLFPAHQWTGAGSGTSAHALAPRTPGLQVVASGLNQPHKLTIGPDGDIYVAEAGDGVIGPNCAAGTGAEADCANNSGSIDRITPQGSVTHVVTGLPSVGSPPGGSSSAGVADVKVVNGKIYGIIQNTNIDPTTGQQTYGPAGALLGDLVSAPLSGGTATSVASFGPYEAANNPDQGAGAGGPGDPPIDSDPYGVVAYNGGFAVADAAANDVLFVNSAGQISTLAVLPLISEPTSGGPPVTAQPVPTSLAVGPDGALYVGELGGVGGPGTGNDVGDVNVYRIAPGGTPTVYASGLTMIGSIAFDQAGRLLVMEIDTAGILDPASSGLPAPGAIIRINADGSQTTLASAGLEFPLGIAVAKDGSVYASNFGVIPATGPAPGISGQLVRVSDPAPAGQLGANLGGYRLAASDGGVFTYGAFGFYGSMGGTRLNQPIVGVASNPVGPGYWLVASDGGIFSFGTSNFYGSTGGMHLNQPIVGMAPTPDGRGYWLVAADGGIFSFGDATFHGSAGGMHINKPIVGMSASPSGGGYDLFASDGGVFTYGDAGFFGSHGGTPLNAAIVSGATTPTGAGYDLTAADGGVFAYGDGGFIGSMGGTHLNKPVVGSQITPDNGGYLLAASDGGIFTFGDAQFSGSAGSLKLNNPVVGIG